MGKFLFYLNAFFAGLNLVFFFGSGSLVNLAAFTLNGFVAHLVWTNQDDFV